MEQILNEIKQGNCVCVFVCKNKVEGIRGCGNERDSDDALQPERKGKE